MAIEIRELLIKVKVEDPSPSVPEELDIQNIKQSIMKECREKCREEIKRQIRNSRDR